MGWERRGSSTRTYFYRSRRGADGTVVKEYVGTGERAASVADAVARSRTEKEADRRAVQEETARLAGPDDLTEELVEVTQLLLETALLAAGYHRQNYGPWRRRRSDSHERSR